MQTGNVLGIEMWEKWLRSWMIKEGFLEEESDPETWKGLGMGRRKFLAEAKVVHHALHLVSLLAYATSIRNGPEDSNPNLLPLTQGFMSKAQHPDFTLWWCFGASRASRNNKCGLILPPQPAVPWSSDTHLTLLPLTGQVSASSVSIPLFFGGLSVVQSPRCGLQVIPLLPKYLLSLYWPLHFLFLSVFSYFSLWIKTSDSWAMCVPAGPAHPACKHWTKNGHFYSKAMTILIIV